jgi:hypothetical protein
MGTNALSVYVWFLAVGCSVHWVLLGAFAINRWLNERQARRWALEVFSHSGDTSDLAYPLIRIKGHPAIFEINNEWFVFCRLSMRLVPVCKYSWQRPERKGE